MYEDEQCVAILDAFPAVPGQTLIIPREPIDYLFALEAETYRHLWDVARAVARALDTVLHPERTCVVVEGFEVPHAHIKLYPTPDATPLGQVLPQQAPAESETLAELANKLRAVLSPTNSTKT